MKAMSRLFPPFVYYLTGAAALLFGIYALLGNGLASEGHLGLEFASSLILVGLVSLWCGRKFSTSAPYRYFLMVFFVLMAGIHIADYLKDAVPVTSPVINSLPILGMLISEWLYRHYSAPADTATESVSA